MKHITLTAVVSIALALSVWALWSPKLPCAGVLGEDGYTAVFVLPEEKGAAAGVAKRLGFGSDGSGSSWGNACTAKDALAWLSSTEKAARIYFAPGEY